MDILNKMIQQLTIKHLPIQAIAATILMFYAKTSLADSCPFYIDSDLGSVVCEFNSGNSVTVANGGYVGSILMDSYSPPSSSFIVIDVGGEIGGDDAAIALTNASSLTEGISNRGTISTNSFVDGIDVFGNSTISGGIINSGEINVGGSGINIVGSTINGNISNSGVISAGASSISIENSNINGNIFNSGIIESTSQGAGIQIRNSLMEGNFLNTGTINGAGNDSGVTIYATTLSGDFINKGSVHAFDGNAVLVSQSTINGDIINTGQVQSTGQRGMEVATNLTLQGDIFNSGTINGALEGLSVHDNALIGTSSGGIVNTGTMSSDGIGLAIYSGNTTIYGNVTNSGIIRGGDIGISIYDSAIINGGINNSGTIQGNTTAISINSDSFVGNLNLIGQSARVIGDIDAVATDMNVTSGALFTSEGTYNVRSLNIAQNALLNLKNTVTVTNGVFNAGTLAVQNTQQIITGNYTQNTGGLFKMNISNASDYGQLIVSDTVDLTQSGHIDADVQQNALLFEGAVLSNVIQGNTLLVPTDGFNVSDNSFLWDFTALLNNSNGVNLTATVNPTAYQICQDAYCQGAAQAILGQVAAGNPLFNAYAMLPSASAFQAAASQATPELVNENVQMTQLITRAVVDITPMWSTLRGRSSGDATLYQPGKIWVKPYGASMTQNERNTVDGFQATAYGAVIGKDIELSHHWLFGGAIAAGGDDMHGKSVLSGQSIHSQAYQGMVYTAKKLPNQFYAAGQGLVGYGVNDTSRAIPLYATTAKGSYNSWFTNIRAEAGWSTSVFSPNLLFTPAIDASYLFINQGSYQETGSPMNLSVARNNNSSLILGAYGNGSYHLTSKNQHNLTFSGYVGVAGDVVNNQPQTLSTFVASGSSFSTFGVQFNSVLFRSGAGLIIATEMKPLVVELNYDLQVGNNAYSGIGSLTVKYKL